MTGDRATTTVLEEAAWLRRLATRLVGDGELAADVSQDVLCAAVRRGAGTRRGWLAGAARRTAAFARRSDARRLRRERFAARPESVASAAELAARAELQRELAEAVESLPDTLRDVVVLRFFEDEPPRAIARRLGIPVNTVRSRVQRAVDELRRRLDDRHGGRAEWVATLAPWARRGGAPAPAVVLASGVPLAPAVAVAVAVLAGTGVWFAFGTAGTGPRRDLRRFGPVAAALARDGTGPQSPVRRRVATGPGIRGRVVDEAGAPVAGAEVCLGSRDWLEHWRRSDPQRAAALVGASGPDGAFALPAPAAAGASRHGGGFELGEPLHAGFVADREGTRWRDGEEPELVMRRTHEVPLAVEVVDRDGAPVPRFTVTTATFWTPHGAGRGEPSRSFVPVARAEGAGGSWRGTTRAVDGLPLLVRIACAGHGLGEWAAGAELGASAASLDPLEREVDVEPGAALRVRFDVDLGAAERRAERVARGRVVAAADGRPLGGVTLRMTTGGWLRKSLTTRMAQSRADGSFAIARPRDGSAGTLIAEHPELEPVSVAAADDVGTMRLVRRGSLACTVVDADGRPLVGAPFLLHSWPDDRRERGATDARGRLSFERLLAGRYDVHVLAEPFDADEDALATGSFVVEAGAGTDATVRLAPRTRFPVRGVLVGAWPVPMVPLFVPVAGAGGWVRAEPRGLAGFDAGGLDVGDYLVLLAPADDGDREAPCALLPPVPVDGFSARALELGWPDGVVSGTVALPADVEAAGLRVVVVPAVPPGGLAAVMLASEKVAERLGVAPGPDGEFRVEHVAAGAHELQLRRGGAILARRPLDVRGAVDVGVWQPR